MNGRQKIQLTIAEGADYIRQYAVDREGLHRLIMEFPFGGNFLAMTLTVVGDLCVTFQRSVQKDFREKMLTSKSNW